MYYWNLIVLFSNFPSNGFNIVIFSILQGNMHPSFPYESGRSRGGEYGSGVGGVRGRGDVLVQSHPGLEDSLVLHNALSSVVEEAQVSVACIIHVLHI